MKANEIEILKRYPNESTSSIAKDFGLTYSQVCYIAYKNNVKKSEEYLNSPSSGRYPEGFKGGEKTQFKKGNVPFNKGKKMDPQVYEICKQTMFKKGHKPHNTKKDDFISWREDKTGRLYAYYKVQDGVWDLLHRKIWTDTHGAIPENNVIYFKDGDTKNLNIENLGIRSKQENMLNNTYVHYPAELKEVIRLKNKLKKKVYGKK